MRTARTLSIVLVILMLAQTLLGLMMTGAYRDEGWINATWFGNDLVTLVLGLPALVLSVWLAGSGTSRGLLLWLGGLGYTFYNYMFYLVGTSLNAFLPLYCLLVVLSAAATLLLFINADLQRLACGYSGSFPARVVGFYLVFVAIGLTAVWHVVWAGYIFFDQPVASGSEPFKIVAALDMTIMVPILLVGGVLLWRRRPLGYALAALGSIQGALYLTVLATNAVVLPLRGFGEWPGEFPLWALLAAGTYAAAGTLVWHARDIPSNQPAAAQNHRST